MEHSAARDPVRLRATPCGPAAPPRAVCHRDCGSAGVQNRAKLSSRRLHLRQPGCRAGRRAGRGSGTEVVRGQGRPQERAGAGPPGRTRGVPAPSSWEAGSRPPPGHRLQRGCGELGDEGGRRHPQPERAVWPLLPPRTCPWPLEPAVGLWDAGPGCPPPHRPSAPRKLESPLECCLPRAPDSSRRGSPPQPRATLPGDAALSCWSPTPTVAGVRPPSPGRRREMLP